ncbi:MAG: hypothetical protein ACUVQP_08005, partial [Bacteroidales bacterium]
VVYFDNDTELPPADDKIVELFKVKIKNLPIQQFDKVKILYNKIYPAKEAEAVSVLNNIPNNTYLFASAITAKAFKSNKILVGKRLRNKEQTNKIIYSSTEFFVITG